ncbi:MAG TPA: DUF1801 domain-containing protein [Cyclobacteriaceae bacterium]|nr:DUF1801 domain-containing protein [Cyclobacteriaceae bacterium]
MAELKTKKTAASVEQFILAIEDETRRDDCFTLIELMKSITKEEPVMWGSSIVGFGSYHYIYASGQEGDWPVAAFSPRKQNLTIYFMMGFDKSPLMEKLGKYKTSKACLYVKRLDDLHIPTLKQLIKASLVDLKKYVAKNKAANQKKKK